MFQALTCLPRCYRAKELRVGMGVLPSKEAKEAKASELKTRPTSAEQEVGVG